MENISYGRELNAPPQYESLKEEVEFRNCSGQSTVVTILSEGPPIRDHIIWSFFNTLFMNFCCLGFFAFIFSVKSRDRKLHGDRHAATSYGSTARSLNIAATVLSILSLVILIIIFIVQMVQLAHNIKEFEHYAEENNLNRFGN
ncbi:hypothetical protein GDO81_016236 [Engystomops pustulosus]|uniref:Interferon-induced transmembrane protein 3 n=1 Tax=Engystomops pustulosus TaxID=76066 RepID=A0AAV7AWL4_ENGPU|nr:hypothetical protein GDO81_016236 [Engystomops pustulosus]